MENPAPPDVLRSPEKLSPSHETIGLQARFLIDTPRALDPNNTTIPEVTGLNTDNIPYARTDAALQKVSDALWKGKEGDDFDRQKAAWSKEMQQRFTDHKGFWNGAKGKAMQEVFKKIGFDPTNIATNTAAIDTFYDTYLGDAIDSPTKKFVDTILHKYVTADGFDYAQLQKDKAAINWLAHVIDGSDLDVVGEIIEARANLTEDGHGMIEAVNHKAAGETTTRINKPTNKEKAIMKLLDDPDAAIQDQQQRQRIQRSRPTPHPGGQAQPAPVRSTRTPPDGGTRPTDETGAGVETERGKFDVGEASEAMHPEHLDRNEDAVMTNGEKGFIGVFDGMGGHLAGDAASRIAKEAFDNALKNLGDNPTRTQIEAAMSEGWEVARQALEAFEGTEEYTQALQEAAGTSRTRGDRKVPGTTASVMQYFTEGGKRYAAILQAGDSRIYSVKNDGSIEQLNTDNSVFIYELAKITYPSLTRAQYDHLIDLFEECDGEDDLPTQLDGYPDELNPQELFKRRNVLTKSLSKTSSAPTVQYRELGDDVAYLAATSDGVHDTLKRSEIQATVTGKTSAQDMADALVAETKRHLPFRVTTSNGHRIAIDQAPEVPNNRHKEDDISAAVIKLTPDSPRATTAPVDTRAAGVDAAMEQMAQGIREGAAEARNRYADRILANENPEDVLKGLPPDAVNAVLETVDAKRQSSEILSDIDFQSIGEQLPLLIKKPEAFLNPKDGTTLAAKILPNIYTDLLQKRDAPKKSAEYTQAVIAQKAIALRDFRATIDSYNQKRAAEGKPPVESVTNREPGTNAFYTTPDEKGDFLFYFNKTGQEWKNPNEPLVRGYITLSNDQLNLIQHHFVDLATRLYDEGIDFTAKAASPIVMEERADNMVFYISASDQPKASGLIKQFLSEKGIGKGHVLAAKPSPQDGLSWALEPTPQEQRIYQEVIGEAKDASFNTYVGAMVMPTYLERMAKAQESVGDTMAANTYRQEAARVQAIIDSYQTAPVDSRPTAPAGTLPPPDERTTLESSAAVENVRQLTPAEFKVRNLLDRQILPLINKDITPAEEATLQQNLQRRLTTAGIAISNSSDTEELRQAYRLMRKQEIAQAKADPTLNYERFKAEHPYITTKDLQIETLPDEPVVIRPPLGSEYSFTIEQRNISTENLSIITVQDKGDDAVGVEQRVDGVINIAVADGVSGVVVPQFSSRTSVEAALEDMNTKTLSENTFAAAFDAVNKVDLDTMAMLRIQSLREKARELIQHAYVTKLQRLYEKGSTAANTLTLAQYDRQENLLRIGVRGDSPVVIFRADETYDVIENATGGRIGSNNGIVYTPDTRSFEPGDEMIIEDISLQDGDVFMLCSDGFDKTSVDFNTLNDAIKTARANGENIQEKISTYIREELRRDGEDDDVSAVIGVHQSSPVAQTTTHSPASTPAMTTMESTVAQPDTSEALPAEPKLTHEELEFYDTYMSYFDARGGNARSDADILRALDRKPFGRQYVREMTQMLKDYGTGRIFGVANAQVERLDQTLQSMGIEPSAWAKDRSWFLWHAAKSRFLANNPTAQNMMPNAEQYHPTDPFAQFKPGATAEQQKASQDAMAEEYYTMLGWEVMQHRNVIFGKIELNTPTDVRTRLQALLDAPRKADGQLSSYQLREIGEIVNQYKRSPEIVATATPATPEYSPTREVQPVEPFLYLTMDDVQNWPTISDTMCTIKKDPYAPRIAKLFQGSKGKTFVELNTQAKNLYKLHGRGKAPKLLGLVNKKDENEYHYKPLIENGTFADKTDIDVDGFLMEEIIGNPLDSRGQNFILNRSQRKAAWESLMELYQVLRMPMEDIKGGNFMLETATGNIRPIDIGGQGSESFDNNDALFQHQLKPELLTLIDIFFPTGTIHGDSYNVSTFNISAPPAEMINIQEEGKRLVQQVMNAQNPDAIFNFKLAA